MTRIGVGDITVDDIRALVRRILDMVERYEPEGLIDIDTAMRIVGEVREILSSVEAGKLQPSIAMDVLSRKMELIESMARKIKPSLVSPSIEASTGGEKVVLHESHRGLSRSSNYYFIAEENKLVHISRYAISQKKSYDMVEYTVDLGKLCGKKVVEIYSSNSGIFCSASIYPAEDLALDHSQRRKEKVPLSFLNSFEFTYLTHYEKTFLKMEWSQYYLPMVRELHMILQQLPYVNMPRLISCQIESQASYPLSFLIPYSESARRRSLEGLTKEIHQLWIVMRILLELNKASKLKDLNLDLTQSSDRAIALFYCKDGLCSLWYEFDMNPHTMCKGMLWYREASNALKYFYQRVRNVLRRKGQTRAPLRPDIAILQGGASCEDLVKDFSIKMVIECKNQDYAYWAKDIETQIIPYKEIFQPDVMVLASLKKVPEHVREYLSRYGVIVIDEVYPEGKGMNELLNLINNTLVF